MTSARADSTGTENYDNFNSSSSGNSKGGKKTRGRALKQVKTSEQSKAETQKPQQDQGKIYLLSILVV